VPTSRSASPARGLHSRILGAIDVGTNAVRLELARPLPDGSFELVHTERDPVRPGEGVFKTGRIPREVEQRLVSTLRRYAALARRHRALVRAVATSAVREAKKAGMVGLKGYRTVGGIRVSTYNAVPYEWVDALAGFMAEFSKGK